MHSILLLQMLYVCVRPVAVLNAAFGMTCRLLMLVEDARGVLCMLVLQMGHSGDGCDLGKRATSEAGKHLLLMSGRGVRSILLLPRVARCLETIDVCKWRMFIFMSVVVIVWGSVGMFGV